ncbi:MAG: hypothetical protein ACFE0S_00005 [Rhodospirillales bacterium]
MADEIVGFKFRFTGGIADENQLGFYDAGRFQYGAARLIHTSEVFRSRRHIPKRVTASIRSEVDLRVRAAEPGSFLQE